MKAELKPRIELGNRTKLETVIPLDVPFTVFVDPSDACNFHCVFCPSGNQALMKKVNRKPRHMDFTLYKKIINDLCELKHPIKVLRLYKDGEPLLNPKFPEMIAYAKERGCALQIDTTTNGALMNPERNLRLIEAGLDRINISVNGMSEAQYRNFSGFRLDFDKFVVNIRHFYEHKKQCLVVVKVCGDVLSQEDKDRFMQTFCDIADRVFIEHVAPCWPEFEMQGVSPNREFGIYGQAIREIMVCPYIFYSLSINSDGSVSLCFLDWARKLIVGDLNRESFLEVLNGQKLFEFRKMHLQKKRKKHPVCGKCGQLSHCLPDDIDPFAEELLKRIESSRKA